jgi:UDP-glucose 4-epimerase
MFVNDVVNIGGSDEVPVLKLAETIIKLTNSSSKIQFLPALKEGDMTRRQPDTAKMKTLLNRPLLPLEEGLRRVIENHHRIH